MPETSEKIQMLILLTLVTSACFSVGETSEGGGIPPPFEDTDWSDKKIYNKTFFL